MKICLCHSIAEILLKLVLNTNQSIIFVCLQMVELVTGSGVYVFDKNIAQAFKVGTEKETGTYSGEKMARYLLNVFWSRKELVGATLSKAGRGKKILNQQIIEAILGKLPLLF